MLKIIFFINLVFNIYLTGLICDNWITVINILYILIYEFIFSVFITIICAFCTIIVVNFLHYLRFNNYIFYNPCLNIIKIFTIHTPELKILSLIVINKLIPYNIINIYSVASIYNLHLILLFLKRFLI